MVAVEVRSVALEELSMFRTCIKNAYASKLKGFCLSTETVAHKRVQTTGFI